MSQLMESLNALLQLEKSMRDFYSAALNKAEIEHMKQDLTKIRDEEIGHVVMVNKMIEIAKEEKN